MADRVITAIRPQRDQRVAVELDGDAWIVIDVLTAARLGLEVDATPVAAVRREAEEAARHERALQRAARLVGRRSHARGELEQRLALRDGADAARAAADRLEAVGAVDDARHAADVAEQRLRSGWGPARIEHDLVQAGVADEVIRSAIAAILPASIDEAARVALGKRTGVDGWQRLAARGFDEAVAERLVGQPDLD